MTPAQLKELQKKTEVATALMSCISELRARRVDVAMNKSICIVLAGIKANNGSMINDVTMAQDAHSVVLKVVDQKIMNLEAKLANL